MLKAPKFGTKKLEFLHNFNAFNFILDNWNLIKKSFTNVNKAPIPVIAVGAIIGSENSFSALYL